MKLKYDEWDTVTEWTNGSKADVYLIRSKDGARAIRKCYRRRLLRPILQEYVSLRYLAKTGIVPEILRFSLRRAEFVLSFIEGQRVLEWVVERFSEPDTDLDQFRSFHGLDSNPIVTAAFDKFRNATDEDSVRLRAAIVATYSKFHAAHYLHGDPSPRNLIYNEDKVFLIDFDHSRPSLNPEAIDFIKLSRWYGVEPAGKNTGQLDN